MTRVRVFVQNKDVALTVSHLGQEESGDTPNPPLNSSTGIRLCTGPSGCDVKTTSFWPGEERSFGRMEGFPSQLNLSEPFFNHSDVTF